MRRITQLLTSLALATGVASAQSLDEYLALRKKHGITQAVGVQALETFVGVRTMEVKGVVKGALTIGERNVLMVERTDGDSLSIEAEFIPEWLVGNSVPARLMLRAERTEEYAPMSSRLLGAAPDHSIARIEEEARRKAAAERAKRAAKKPPSKASGKDWSLPTHEVLPHYAAFIKGRNKRLSDSEAWKIAEGIVGFSIRYGVDARLILAMVLVESGFNPDATSRAGAMGLGQLMPGTARGMGITNAYDTMQNLYGTVRVIRGHVERYYAKTKSGFEALVLGLAAYNAGSGAVRRHNGVPPYRETQNYIRKVVDAYAKLIGAK